jgi:hypothetical protein
MVGAVVLRAAEDSADGALNALPAAVGDSVLDRHGRRVSCRAT